MKNDITKKLGEVWETISDTIEDDDIVGDLDTLPVVVTQDAFIGVYDGNNVNYLYAEKNGQPSILGLILLEKFNTFEETKTLGSIEGLKGPYHTVNSGFFFNSAKDARHVYLFMNGCWLYKGMDGVTNPLKFQFDSPNN